MLKTEYIICGDIKIILFGNYNEEELLTIKTIIENVQGFFGSNLATEQIIDELDQNSLNMPFFKENKMIVFWKA